jgi:hypothetical protein
MKAMQHWRNEAFDRGLETMNVDRSSLDIL